MKGQQAIGTLVIFIALVITAALASFVLVSTTNALQSKSLAVSQKTMEKATMGFSARQVEGIANADGSINKIMMGIELSPGSETIDMQDATLIWTANGGTIYDEYQPDTTWTAGDYNYSDFSSDTDTAHFKLIDDRSSSDDKDRYLESGELYVIGFTLPTGDELKEGQDWKIILRAPYTQDLIVTGYAPEVIQGGQIITLKSA